MHGIARRSNARLAAIALIGVSVLVACCCAARADYTVFSDNFDDGDWTSNPRWEYAQTGPVTVSNERSTSGGHSLKVASNNELGAIRSFSCLSSASQSYTCTFDLYVESMGDEAIPWCLQSTSNATLAIIFILPGGTVQLFVADSVDIWSGKSANVPYPLTYGQWHPFRLTYDGSTTSLYLDGHAQPDASVTQTYVRAPAKLCVGNFSLPHTSTFYLDTMRIATPEPINPARVYVQVCSDTSTSALDVNSHYNSFPALDASYTSPSGQAAQVMAESFRDTHRDSLGNTIKFTWYMLVGSMYSCGTNTGSLLALDLMMDYHGDAIEQWGDELAYHYHTWIWSDPDQDGICHWNQAPEFAPCVDDFEQTVAHMILDRMFYPTSFRSGWHYMDNFFQAYLDDWFPYRFEDDYPNVRTETAEPIDNVYDWSRAPSAWAPYHPDPNDYQSPGSLRGWDSRSRYMSSLSRAQAEDAFVQALGGTPQLMTLFSHLKETDFPSQVSNLHSLLASTHDALPLVDFVYCTGKESMLEWRGGSDTTAPTIQVTTSDAGGLRTAVFGTDEPIYQLQPFVARTGTDGAYSRADCTSAGPNRWQVQYSIGDTIKMGVGVTDWFGNAAVRFLPTPLRVFSVEFSAGTTSVDLSWETSAPADSRVEYRLLPAGATTYVFDGEYLLRHRVTLSNLLPGRVYEIHVCSEDEYGQQACSEPVYALTRAMEPVIIDNSDPGFSTIGSWATGNTAPGRYGEDYRYAGTSPTGTSRALWTWPVSRTDTYNVYAWWSSGSNRSTAARYSVIHQGSEFPTVVNQQVDGGQWNLLGTYTLSFGSDAVVSLSNAAPSGYVVIADAVKFEPAYTPIDTVGIARLLSDGTAVTLSDVPVTGTFDGEFYVEEPDRSAGMLVLGSGVETGDVVDVSGKLTTIRGSRALRDPVVKPSGETLFLDPLALGTRDVYNPAAPKGLNNIGLLVTIWGRVTSVETDSFYVDDGFARKDGSGSIGLRVDASQLSSAPSTGQYVVVTGVLGTDDAGGAVLAVLRPRDQADVRHIPEL